MSYPQIVHQFCAHMVYTHANNVVTADCQDGFPNRFLRRYYAWSYQKLTQPSRHYNPCHKAFSSDKKTLRQKLCWFKLRTYRNNQEKTVFDCMPEYRRGHHEWILCVVSTVLIVRQWLNWSVTVMTIRSRMFLAMIITFWASICGLVKWVSAFGLSNNKWWWWMWFSSSLQAGLWLKSVGLVQRSAAVCYCSAFTALTGWTLAMTLSHDDSTTNIVLVIIFIIIFNFITSTTINSWL